MVVSIAAFQAGDTGSIPGHRIDNLLRTLSAASCILKRVDKNRANATFDSNRGTFFFIFSSDVISFH